MSPESTGTRAIALAIAASALGVLLLVLLLPPLYATPDEAKYVGLGYNILAGKGPVTDFGVRFLNHAPVWALVLAVPQAWLGVEALTVGHLLDALAAAATVLFTGLLAWRVRPLAGAVAAIALLGLPYLTHLSRTAGLDMPAVAFSLAYLWVALRALDRGSVSLGLVSGLVFGIAFLIKETALPFLPVPFLAALTVPVALVTIARVGAAALAAGALTTSWWFAIHGALGGTVYRLGTPAWTLAPLAAVVVALVVLGLAAQPVAARLHASGRLAAISPTRGGRLRWIAAWMGLAAWVGGQLFVFARAAKLGGAPLIRLGQLADDVRAYRDELAPVVAFGVIGGLFGLALLRRSPTARALLMANLAFVPLVLLVLGIGETPRHYMANVAVLVAFAAPGWVHAVESAARGDRRWLVAASLGLVAAVAIAWPVLPGHRLFKLGLVGGTAIAVVAWMGLRRLAARRPGAPDGGTRALRLLAGTGALLAVLLVVAGVVTGRAEGRRSVVPDRQRAAAVAEIAAWLDTNATPGSTVAVGHDLGYELAATDRDRPYVRIGPRTAVVDPRSPSGLRWQGDGQATDVIRIDTALHNVDQLDAFGVEELTARIRTFKPSTWVEARTVPAGQASAPTFELLDATPGMRRLETWRYPGGSTDLVAVAYGVDPAAVRIAESPLYATPAGVRAVARGLASSDGQAAAALLDRLVVVPPGPGADAALAELAAVAAGSGSGAPSPQPSPASPAPGTGDVRSRRRV